MLKFCARSGDHISNDIDDDGGEEIFNDEISILLSQDYQDLFLSELVEKEEGFEYRASTLMSESDDGNETNIDIHKYDDESDDNGEKEKDDQYQHTQEVQYGSRQEGEQYTGGGELHIALAQGGLRYEDEGGGGRAIIGLRTETGGDSTASVGGARRTKHNKLTVAICGLLDEYSMVSFIPMNINDE